MMNDQKRATPFDRLATVTPTALSFNDVATWVIWQFPRYRGEWLCGAVRPPQAKKGWIPALINPQEGRLLVYGNLDQEFESPEAAAERCQRLRDVPK